jgi:hypothetical protein
MRLLWLALAALSLCGCGSSVPNAAPVAGKLVEHAKPADESRKMPLDGRVSAGIVEDHILGIAWLQGGTLGHKKGGKEWDLILVKADSPATAADWLLRYKKELTGAKLVPSFGGFYGMDQGKPTFLFTKGAWLAGVQGLPEAEADAVARPFAARIQ